MARTNDGVRVGRTIAEKWEHQESESERLAARKKEKTKKIVKILLLAAILCAVVGIVAMEVIVWTNNRAKEAEEAKIPVPTVEIVDESGSGVTSRMKEYVAVIEQDFYDLGLSVDRAVVPAGKMREVHVFLRGYPYYVKLNIDRDTAVSAEDTKRMVAYLEEHNITPEYLDVRVKGKAYYK